MATRSSSRLKRNAEVASIEAELESKNKLERVDKDNADATSPAPADKKKTSKKTKVEENQSALEKVIEGKPFPSGFILKNQEDEIVNLSEIVKSQGVIVFFYPRANTPGCTKQGMLKILPRPLN